MYQVSFPEGKRTRKPETLLGPYVHPKIGRDMTAVVHLLSATTPRQRGGHLTFFSFFFSFYPPADGEK